MNILEWMAKAIFAATAVMAVIMLVVGLWWMFISIILDGFRAIRRERRLSAIRGGRY